ncbi:MAG: hypothetical protein Q4C42_06430 [Clostridia bacterium]|nr:hypothetical protein [Clostridia bacterium]
MDNNIIEEKKISEETLKEVAGGTAFTAYTNGSETVVYKKDDQGRPTHFAKADIIWHYKCPKCGKIMHEGFLGAFYCDPCDDWYKGVSDYIVYDRYYK